MRTSTVFIRTRAVLRTLPGIDSAAAGFIYPAASSYTTHASTIDANLNYQQFDFGKLEAIGSRSVFRADCSCARTGRADGDTTTIKPEM